MLRAHHGRRATAVDRLELSTNIGREPGEVYQQQNISRALTKLTSSTQHFHIVLEFPRSRKRSQSAYVYTLANIPPLPFPSLKEVPLPLLLDIQ